MLQSNTLYDSSAIVWSMVFQKTSHELLEKTLIGKRGHLTLLEYMGFMGKTLDDKTILEFIIIYQMESRTTL